jgi:peroxiredoxin
MKRLLLLLAAAVLALSACSGGSDAVDQTSNSFHFTSGTPLGSLYPSTDRKHADDFTGQLLDGGTISLAATRGKVVVLNFWATWCPPCRTETPQFDLVYRQVKSRGVDFIGIDTKDIKGSAQAFVADNHISYPIVYDEEGRAALQLGNLPAAALPFTVLIDKQGRVAAVYTERLAAKDLITALDKLLAEH